MSHIQARHVILSRPLCEHGAAQHTVSVQPLAAPPYLADSSWSLRTQSTVFPFGIKGVLRRLTRFKTFKTLNVPENASRGIVESCGLAGMSKAAYPSV